MDARNSAVKPAERNRLVLSAIVTDSKVNPAPVLTRSDGTHDIHGCLHLRIRDAEYSSKPQRVAVKKSEVDSLATIAVYKDVARAGVGDFIAAGLRLLQTREFISAGRSPPPRLVALRLMARRARGFHWRAQRAAAASG